MAAISKPRLKIALIGCGGISRGHARAYRHLTPEVAEVTAVADAVDALAAERATELGVSFATADYRAVLDRPDVEAVDICLPHHLHAEVAIAAARAGKHVLVEKPMACSLEECRAMIDAATKAKVTLMVAQTQRYTPSYRGVKQVCSSGELGPIHAVRFDSMQNARAFLPRHHWLFDGRLAGGGIIISVSVHRIDLVRYFLGDVRRVQALARPVTPPFVHGAEDYAAALLEFENGAIGEHFATYSGYRMPYSESFMIFGEDGAVHALPQQGHGAGPAFFITRGREADKTGAPPQFEGFLPVPPDNAGLWGEDGFANEIHHFAQCCRSGEEPLTSGSDNLGTMKVILAMYRSLETRGWVDLNSL